MSLKTTKLGNVTVPAHLKGVELLKWMVENKSALIAEKKEQTKHADIMRVDTDVNKRYFVDKEGRLCKEDPNVTISVEKSESVLVVINSSNWMDSHDDVHIPGLWSKSIKENSGRFVHLQEHTMKFTHIISDSSKGYTEKMKWKDLGLNMSGETEALLFATEFTGRNAYMEEQYRKGYVKMHSVGMRYVIMKLCVNEPDDEYFKEEYANWSTYFPMVANKERAEDRGYFWAILEAKIVEGSAVPVGSNIITPTIGITKSGPAPTTQTNEPEQSTQGQREEKSEEVKNDIDWSKLAGVIA